MLRLDVGQIPNKVPILPKPGPPKPAWYKATEEQVSTYTDVLADRLDQMDVPISLSCRDVNCDSHRHKEDRDSYMLDVLCAICDSGKECLPQTGGKPPKTQDQPDRIEKIIPGWREQIAPYRDKSVFWFSVWQSAGRPLGGELHNIVKSTRAQYHYAVRRVKRMADTIRADKLLEAAMAGNGNLLKELKKAKSSGRHAEPDHVDGAISDDIPEQFANVYKQLFNSVDDREGLDALKELTIQ